MARHTSMAGRRAAILVCLALVAGFSAGAQASAFSWGRSDSPSDTRDVFSISPLGPRGDRGARQQQHPLRRRLLADGSDPSAVLAVPKVAMLFLTPGPWPHEPLWSDFFNEAAGLIPADFVVNVTSGLPETERQAKLDELAGAMRQLLSKPGATAVDKQILYTLYVHPHPDFAGYPKGSILAGHEIGDRVEVKRMHHSVIEGEKVLLKAALREPLNQMFILVSESALPVYPPTMMYEQLLSEGVSRVDGCTVATQFEDNLDRWSPPMSKREHWRKTSQWFSLRRDHARIVADDVAFNKEFAEHCFPRTETFENGRTKWISCSDNEHYVAVVLAASGLGHETACWPGGTTYVDWTKMTREGRPKSFAKSEITPASLSYVRRSKCDWKRCFPTCATSSRIQLALLTAKHRFWSSEELAEQQLRGGGGPGGGGDEYVPEYARLDAKCALLVRKIHAEHAELARGVFQDFIRHPSLEQLLRVVSDTEAEARGTSHKT